MSGLGQQRVKGFMSNLLSSSLRGQGYVGLEPEDSSGRHSMYVFFGASISHSGLK